MSAGPMSDGAGEPRAGTLLGVWRAWADGLARPAAIRRLIMAGIAVLGLTLVADLLQPHESHAGIGGSFGFGAWFGFASCVVLVLVSRLLGRFLKRPDDRP